MSQDDLKQMLERRHPFYGRCAHWDFLEDTYDGGRDWFDENIFKFFKEGDGEYTDRVARAYRPNHTREVVELVNKYLFKSEVARKEGDAPDYIKKFWANATLTRGDITDLMRLISGKSSIFGKPWCVVDSTVAGAVATKADEAAGDARVYAYTLKPQDVLDMAFDKQGDLVWLLHAETKRDDEDPLTASGEVQIMWRLWTRNHWALFGLKVTPKKKEFYVAATGAHDLGVVPIIGCPHVVSDDLYWSPGLIDDVAYMDRAIANYLSNIDAIIQDQTFSQLVIPAQSLMPGEEGEDQMKEMGTKRIFTYDAQGGIAPAFIAPDPRQAGLILSIISKIVGEIYQTVGMSGERTKQDNATGIDNSSGVAKAYDFDRMNAMLAAKAKSLEVIENKLVALVSLYNSEGDPNTIFTDPDMKLVTYPANFDVRGLYDEFEIASSLAMMGAPDEVRRKQMEQLIDKLFPSLTKNVVEEIKASVNKDWPPADPTLQSTGAMPPFSPKPAKPAPTKAGTGSGTNNKPAPKTSKPQK
jgi:hypothetical protein